MDQPQNDRVDPADVIDEPFVNYQERMTRAMKELTKKGHDMVSKTEHIAFVSLYATSLLH